MQKIPTMLWKLPINMLGKHKYWLISMFAIGGLASTQSAGDSVPQLKYQGLDLSVHFNKIKAQKNHQILWDIKLASANYHQLQTFNNTLVVIGDEYKYAAKDNESTIVYAIDITAGRVKWLKHFSGRYTESVKTISSGAVAVNSTDSGAVTVGYINVYRLEDGVRLDVPDHDFDAKATFNQYIVFEDNPSPPIDVDSTPEYVDSSRIYVGILDVRRNVFLKKTYVIKERPGCGFPGFVGGFREDRVWTPRTITLTRVDNCGAFKTSINWNLNS